MSYCGGRNSCSSATTYYLVGSFIAFRTSEAAVLCSMKNYFRHTCFLLQLLVDSTTTFFSLVAAAAVGFFCRFHFCRVHLGGWLAINFFFLVKAVVVRWLCLSKLSMWQAVCNLVLLLSFDRSFFFPKLFLYEVHVAQ